MENEIKEGADLLDVQVEAEEIVDPADKHICEGCE